MGSLQRSILALCLSAAFVGNAGASDQLVAPAPDGEASVVAKKIIDANFDPSTCQKIEWARRGMDGTILAHCAGGETFLVFGMPAAGTDVAMNCSVASQFGFACDESSLNFMTQEECGIYLDDLTKQGLLTDVQGKNGRPVIVVSEAAWSRIDYKAKVGLAKICNCAAVGPGMVLSSMEFRSNMTNQVLGTWDLGQLSIP